ncbi:MAG: hypothetical protein HWE30_00395 [Methylocystaceae bacterium]|nr:hypothetical protein [Methylocystaceae bacterium]
MTKITDEKLNRWLDHSRVDTSEARLSRLQDEIMLQIDMEENDLYTPMNWRQIAVTVCGAGLIAGVLVLLSSGGYQANEASVLMANAILYGGF